MLFRSYLGSLEHYPRTDNTAIAELAATNAYLLYISRKAARRGISSTDFEAATTVESLLLFLFGAKADLKDVASRSGNGVCCY